MGFYDAARQPDADKDPTKDIQWDIAKLANSVGTSLLSIIDASFGAFAEAIGGLFNGLFKALLSGDVIGGIEDLLINLPGVGFLVKAILGDGAEVGDLADWFTDAFGSIATLLENVPILGLIIKLLKGELTPDTSGQFPMTFPFPLGGSAAFENPLLVFFKNFLQLFNPVNWLNIAFDPLNEIKEFINGMLKPSGLLAWLEPLTGLLPDELVPQFVFDFIDTVVDVIKSVPGGGLLAGVIDFWADFVNSLLGHGPTSVPAYTPTNSAIANVQGQINTIQAQISATGNGVSDGFNIPGVVDPVNWAALYGTAHVDSGGFAFNVGGAGDRYTAQKWLGDVPTSAHWQTQMTLILPGSGGNTAIFGQHRFGGGGNAAMDARMPAVECYVDQFGFFIRLGSIDGPINDFFLGNAGWTQYGQVNAASYIKTGDVLALECIEASKLYNLYLNPGPGVDPIISFVDTSNTIPRGASNRIPYFQLNVLNDAFGVGNGWDNFYCFDRDA